MLDADPPAPEPGASANKKAQGLRRARLRRDPLAEPSTVERAWTKGAEGERRLGLALNEAVERSSRVAVMHDLTLERKLANIDHLVIGPSGVTILDAKAWGGRVSIGKGTLWQGRRPRSKVVEGMRHQVHRVVSVLAAAGRDDVPVRGVLAFVDDNKGLVGRPVQWLDGVGVGCAEPAVALALADGPLESGDVRAVLGILRSAFRVAGGVMSPAPAISVAAPVERPLTVSDVLAATPRRRLPRVPLRRPLTIVGVAFALLFLVALALELIGTGVQRATEQTRYMTRAELRSRLPELRQLARRASGERVHRTSIGKDSTAFLVRYRHGSCRVLVRVTRLPKLGLPQSRPSPMTSSCRR